jgi:hypothetical protein
VSYTDKQVYFNSYLRTTDYYRDAFYECISLGKHTDDNKSKDIGSYVTITASDGTSVSVVMDPITGGNINPNSDGSTRNWQYVVEQFMVDKTHPSDWFVRGVGLPFY